MPARYCSRLSAHQLPVPVLFAPYAPAHRHLYASAYARERSGELRRDHAVAAFGREGEPYALYAPDLRVTSPSGLPVTDVFLTGIQEAHNVRDAPSCSISPTGSPWLPERGP